MTPIEEDIALWLMSGTVAEARRAFDERHGPDGPHRFARAARAIAYLQAHHEPLREAGLVALGERPEDVRIERGFADALTAACEPR